MKRLAIVGSGDLGCQLAMLGSTTGLYKPVGFFNDYEEKGKIINDLPILGGLDQIVKQYEANSFDEIIIGIGYNHMDVRAAIYDKLSSEIPFATLVHPSSFIDPSCEVVKRHFLNPDFSWKNC